MSGYDHGEDAPTYDEREKLRQRIQALEVAIRFHRDQKSDDRCWMDDQELYKVLGDGNLGDNRVGDQTKMLKNCQRFIQRRTEGGGWTTYAAMEKELALLKSTAYVTHTCGAILETRLLEILADEGGKFILYVYCPGCDSDVTGGEDDEYYLVRKP